jgi:hypothetical protein
MKYFNPLVDKEPIDVFVIQEHKERIEISRTSNAKAGFWINKS